MHLPGFLRLPALALAMTGLAACAANGGAEAPRTATTAPAAGNAATQALVDRINVPFERFTLANGLTVIVHTDRKAPVVGVSVWYGVGSKDEPAGSTGFAHLFEHLMFNGSENAPGDTFTWLQNMGATDYNGTTSFDRTNYFETVPTGALDRALFLEADRMGHLLGGVDQAKLDNQRGVVQNEKRQGDNQPYGLLRYYIFENLVPPGHPYYHSTIGSMADLNAASLNTVQNWFRANYGPNNAVLVLAGDIDAAQARPMVERWFGGIPRGPQVRHPHVDVPTLPAPLARTVTDQIATTRLFRMWTVPGYSSADIPALQVAASVLGGLASSRLDNALVRGEQLAVGVSASVQPFEDLGVFVVSADVKPGVDPALVGQRLDAIIAEFRRDGPSADEVQRAVMSGLSGTLDSLEDVGGFGGKAGQLAQAQLYAGDPAFFEAQIRRFAAETPAHVQAVTDHWLSRPVFSLTYRPGPRTDSGDHHGGNAVGGGADAVASAMIASHYVPYRSANERAMAAPATIGAPARADRAQQAPSTPAPATTAAPAGSPAPRADAIAPPPLLPTSALDFPTIERARLNNGIPVYFAHRAAVPTVRVAIGFDAGAAADPHDRAGLQGLMLGLMEQGTETRDARTLLEAQERLGASISTSADSDHTYVGLYALASNLAPSLDLLADVVRHPAFAPAEIERLRTQQLTGIAAELNSPAGLAARATYPLLYGPTHPYGAVSGSGTIASVRAITRGDITGFHQAWIRPDNAAIYVVGDVTLAEAVRDLNASFGDWAPPAVARGTKDFAAAIPDQRPRILLVNRPNSPQSMIVVAQVLGVNGRDDLVTLRAANEVLGAGFLSRINMDLRETKGWSYGARSTIGDQDHRVLFRIVAPVQADKTGDSIRAIRTDVDRFLGPDGVNAEERDRTVNGATLQLPGQFESSSAVLSGIEGIIERGRPDDYFERLPERYAAMTAAGMDAAIRAQLRPDHFVYIVVGDAAIVRPQLDSIGLPVESVDPATLGGQETQPQ